MGLVWIADCCRRATLSVGGTTLRQVGPRLYKKAKGTGGGDTQVLNSSSPEVEAGGSQLETSLVYRVSCSTAWAIQRNPVSKILKGWAGWIGEESGGGGGGSKGSKLSKSVSSVFPCCSRFLLP